MAFIDKEELGEVTDIFCDDGLNGQQPTASDADNLIDYVATSVNHDNWQEFADCRGVEQKFFYPKSYEEKDVALAKDFCSGCLVAKFCLEFAIKNGEKHGIWGGLTPGERNKL